MNKIKKNVLPICAAIVLALCLAFSASGCAALPSGEEFSGEVTAKSWVDKCYDKIVYIDKNLSDRDCIGGPEFNASQKYIIDTAKAAGYTDVTKQEISFNAYVKKDADTSAAAEFTWDGKFYKRQGRKYVEAEEAEATHIKGEVKTHNVVVKVKGKSEEQIIVGAHYDGDGSGDNGSGIALALTMLENLAGEETPYSLVFVFFTAEEYGCYGSTAYADAMSDEEVANTKYMINMDSLICGDYCYLYGGVQDDDTQTVNMTEAYDNAMNLAKSLGLNFRSNPWTYENPAPGYDTPDYASPSTGDWSDHVGFKERGIQYVYFEATNWEIPGPYEEYDGYGETYLVGMLMNTENDYLEFIEKYFPGRPQQHLSQFFPLLRALLIQPKLPF